MSRVSLLEQLKVKRKSALEFDFEKLWAPPIISLFTPADIQELIRIATSIRYNGNINKKYELIDAVMRRRGFRRVHSGTNRVVYNFLESSAFVAKVAIDKVGMTDSPKEFINQQYFQPFCCRIFEVDPSGVIAFVERVNPISSIEEFLSVADDVFNMMVTKIIGKYVVDDLGTRTYMNFGIRQNANGYTFGPVIIDFPYVYELDGAKLTCQTMIQNKLTGETQPCGGDIDYKPGFNGLICTKCGREYKAIDLAKGSSNVKFEYDSKDKALVQEVIHRMRARIIDNGAVVKDSGRSVKHYLSKEEFETMVSLDTNNGEVEVGKTVRKKREKARDFRNRYYSELQRQYYEEFTKKNSAPFNPVMVKETVPKETTVDTTVRRKKNPEQFVPVEYVSIENKLAASTDPIPVIETVDRNGNPITIATQKEAYEHVEALEKDTFPEMNNPTPEVAPAIIPINTPANKPEATSEVPVYYSDAVPTGKVFSDEEVATMVKENAMRNNETAQKVEASTILDPEADKDPIGSPITRPYAIAGGLVNANHKITADEGQPTIPMTSPFDAAPTMTDDADTSDEEQDAEPIDPPSYNGGHDSDYDDYEDYAEEYNRRDRNRDIQRRNNRKMKRSMGEY